MTEGRHAAALHLGDRTSRRLRASGLLIRPLGGLGFLCELRRSGEPRVRAIRAFRLCEAVLGWRDHGIGTGLFVGLPWFYGPEKRENNLNKLLDNIVRMFVEW